MAHPAVDDRYRDYREAIRRRVCVICLDGTDDAGCGLPGPSLCAIEEHLPRLVEAVLDVRLHRRETFAAAVETRVCAHCVHRDAFGLCHLRRDGRCAVSVYLPLVVEAIEEVETRRPTA